MNRNEDNNYNDNAPFFSSTPTLKSIAFHLLVVILAARLGTVTFVEVNEAPTDITLSNSSVIEHSASNTVVGTLTGIDPDTGATLTYALINNAGGRFIICGSALMTAGSWTALDYATATPHTVTVEATDQSGLNYSKSFAIAVTPDHYTVQNPNGTTTNVIYDAPDFYSWVSFRTESNAQGNPYYQIGTTDGGGTWENEYDPAGAQSWSTRMTVRNGSGQLLSRTTNNDDGTHTLVAYDVTNSYDFSTFTMTFAPAQIEVPSEEGSPQVVTVDWIFQSVTGTNDNGTTNLNLSEVWNVYDTLLWYANPYVVTQGSLGGGEDGLPVILDLDGDGVEVTPLDESTAHFDMDDRAGRNRTAWVGRNDGLLAIDLAADGEAGPDGRIDQTDEIVFTEWAPGVTSDMAAVRQIFDSNRNGSLDAGDARWSEFRIWQDTDGDGASRPGEVKALDELGIASINLNPTGPARTLGDGSAIQGLSTYVRTNGTTGAAGDVSLAYDAASGDELLAVLERDKQHSTFGMPYVNTPYLVDGGRADGLSQLVQAMAVHSADHGGLESKLVSNEIYGSQQAILAPAWHQ